MLARSKFSSFFLFSFSLPPFSHSDLETIRGRKELDKDRDPVKEQREIQYSL
jgi:hypothetical protein